MFEYIQGEKFKELGNIHEIYYSPTHQLELENIPDYTKVIITHNSDWSASQVIEKNPKILEFLVEKKIKWFSSNNDVIDYHIFSLPIGLENDCWQLKNNKIDKISLLSHKRSDKEFLLNAIFNSETHPSRQSLMDTFIDLDWCVSYDSINGTGFDEYIKIVHNSCFTLCPRGNGWDTHRVWETLYLGGTAILESNAHTLNLYTDIPNIFIVKDLNDLNKRFLQNHWNVRANNFGHVNEHANWEKLDMKYWRRKILRYVV